MKREGTQSYIYICINIYIYTYPFSPKGFPDGSVVKNKPAVEDTPETLFDQWVRKISWKR